MFITFLHAKPCSLIEKSCCFHNPNCGLSFKKALFDTKHDCYALHHNSCCVRDSNSLSSRARFTVWCDTPSSPTQLLLKRYCYKCTYSPCSFKPTNNVCKYSNILVERLRIELSNPLMRPSGNLQELRPLVLTTLLS